MQIPPTSALLRALSTSATPAGPRPAAAGAPTSATANAASIRATGAMAAAQKALAARANAVSTLPPPGAQPTRPLPRGSLINIVV